MKMYELLRKGETILFVGRASLAPVTLTITEVADKFATAFSQSGREVTLTPDMYFGLTPHVEGAFFKSKGPAMAYLANRGRSVMSA